MISEFIGKIAIKVLIILAALIIGFSSGCTYKERQATTAEVVELKEEKKETKIVNEDLNEIAGKNEKVKEVIRTVYVPKIQEKIKIEVRDKIVYRDSACTLPDSGVKIMDDTARELNEKFLESSK